ncbi:type III restriction enzyme [Cellulomonas marina]|uniref:Type III restriction enzyme n=2 Tax=Cellulomonas marina TaxID=988821 RepID=A0A1I0X9J1_9CELL|nr:DEAD/DEAH box helicase family protein [Cellulomonas marina]SFA97086.1 type III restriction enzyme [Cellulomonas marina]
MPAEMIDNPVLNRPYDEPSRHWMQDAAGHLTRDIAPRRRPSESWVPVPQVRKGRSVAAAALLVQDELDVTLTGERKDVNSQINQLRAEVRTWRTARWPGVTMTTRRLLMHWSDPDRDNRVFFAQREAVETAIYVAEVAGRRRTAETGRSAGAQGSGWVLDALAEQNATHNAGLPRVALKMATGTGKTVVMAMLIAWQTLNKAVNPRDTRFTQRFLVVTPGITIRDRLRVLHPADAGSYYRERDLVPADLWPQMSQARVSVTNFHAFMLRTRKEGQGISATTKKLLAAQRTGPDPFVETEAQMVARVLRDVGGARGRAAAGSVMVLNDEAHHCYLPRSTDEDVRRLQAEVRKEAKEANDDAGVWFSGLQRIHAAVGIKAVYDLSATPYFLAGSGYPEGLIHPWVVSDFSLMDAIESGLVKIPRLPVKDDAEGSTVAYRDLWPLVSDELPKRAGRGGHDTTRPLPAVLAGALQTLYSSYQRAFARWEERALETPDAAGAPPVFIVVCPNTTVSKWVYDQIAGYEYEMTDDEGVVHPRTEPGTLALLSNIVEGRRVSSPRTILVDSAELESGESVSKDFRAAAADEIEAFRREYVARTGAAADELDDAQLLREVLNTVGKPGRLGGQVRCVVSVSMLSEGWDANTVTHVLGVRAFGSQLLCEQVVGRGLRRRSYALDEDGMLPAEYAEVYGIPFAFIPSDRPVGDPPPRPPAVRVQAVAGREAARIVFPRVQGYRFELPDERLHLDLDDAPIYELGNGHVATATEVEGVVGVGETHTLDEWRAMRPTEVAFKLAVRTLLKRFADPHQAPKPWLVPELVRITRTWMDQCVRYTGEAFPGLLLIGTEASRAAEAIERLVMRQSGTREPVVRALIRADDPTGSTEEVDFLTTKQVHETNARSHVSHVVLDGSAVGGGNTWEKIAAQDLEVMDGVAAYTKNDHLEFSIPYVHDGVGRRYKPDFLVRLERREGDGERYLILEVSGGRKDQAAKKAKADTARDLWCAAVNADGRFGRWGYVEVTDPFAIRTEVAAAIQNLYDDLPITGQPLAPRHSEDLFAGLDDDPRLVLAAAGARTEGAR